MRLCTSLARCSNPLADSPTEQRGFERKTRETYSVSRVCVGYELSSRAVSSQVFLPLQRLTSVFGMGTGGPTALITLTTNFPIPRVVHLRGLEPRTH